MRLRSIFATAVAFAPLALSAPARAGGADEFLPAMEALLNRPNPPEHLVIETSGLALPKPLLKAFGWPSIRSRVTVDGVIAVVDGPAVASGRFADDPDAVIAAIDRARVRAGL